MHYQEVEIISCSHQVIRKHLIIKMISVKTNHWLSIPFDIHTMAGIAKCCLKIMLHFIFKVEKILKEAWIISHHLHLQWESLREMWGQNIAGHCQQTFENKKFVDVTQQCFALLPRVTIPPMIWIFTESEGPLPSTL